MEKIRTHFWRRWSREYLTQLQSRSKWQKQQDHPDALVGSLALIIEENVPPLTWKTGRITEIHPGDDGVVRVVTIKTVHGLTKRALRKVCVLPIVRDQLTLLMMRTDYYRCFSRLDILVQFSIFQATLLGQPVVIC